MLVPVLNEYIANANILANFGKYLAKVLANPPLLVYISGEVGAGKTTLVRSYLQEIGIKGPIKSPTFGYVEEYQLQQFFIYHFDLYRLSSVADLERLAISDYIRDDAIILLEWPEIGSNYLPEPQLRIDITINGQGRQLSVAAASYLHSSLFTNSSLWAK